MSFIMDFIDWITNFFKTVWDIINGVFDNLLLLFSYIGVVAEMAYSLIAGLPDWLKAFGTLTIVVSVIYIILGRQTGGKHE